MLEIAEQFYDRLLKIAVNNTYIPSHLATQTNVIEPNSLNGSVRLTDIKRKSDSTFPLEKRDPYEDSAIVRFEPYIFGISKENRPIYQIAKTGQKRFSKYIVRVTIICGKKTKRVKQETQEE